MKLLEKEYDFIWYKKGLDVEKKSEHKHEGEPSEYPCKVESEWWEGAQSRDPDCYLHSFIYKQENKCTSCGHVDIDWPKEPTNE